MYTQEKTPGLNCIHWPGWLDSTSSIDHQSRWLTQEPVCACIMCGPVVMKMVTHTHTLILMWQHMSVNRTNFQHNWSTTQDKYELSLTLNTVSFVVRKAKETRPKGLIDVVKLLSLVIHSCHYSLLIRTSHHLIKHENSSGLF